MQTFSQIIGGSRRGTGTHAGIHHIQLQVLSVYLKPEMHIWWKGHFFLGFLTFLIYRHFSFLECKLVIVAIVVPCRKSRRQ
jgi:hypothetical protein